MSNLIAPYQTNSVSCYNDSGLTFTGVNYNVILSANTEQHFTIPDFIPPGSGLTYKVPTYYVIFKVGKSTGDVFAAYNNTAAVATGSIALSSSFLVTDKDMRFCFSGNTLSLISTATCTVSMSFYFKS